MQRNSPLRGSQEQTTPNCSSRKYRGDLTGTGAREKKNLKTVREKAKRKFFGGRPQRSEKQGKKKKK